MIRSQTGYVIQDPRGEIKAYENLNYLPGTQVSILITSETR
jgi:hypothetical protein